MAAYIELFGSGRELDRIQTPLELLYVLYVTLDMILHIRSSPSIVVDTLRFHLLCDFDDCFTRWGCCGRCLLCRRFSLNVLIITHNRFLQEASSGWSHWDSFVHLLLLLFLVILLLLLLLFLHHFVLLLLLMGRCTLNLLLLLFLFTIVLLLFLFLFVSIALFFLLLFL